MKSDRVGTLRVALVQMNASVGALAANARGIVERAHGAAKGGADLIVFPEMALSGYPPEGLLRNPDFLSDCAKELRALAASLPPEPVVVLGAPIQERKAIFNAAVVFQGGRLRGVHRKRYLSDSDVFDERDFFEAGVRASVVDIGGLRVGLLISDEVCSTHAPQNAFRGAGVAAVVTTAALAFRRGALAVRRKVLGALARLMGVPVLSANLVGGQDESVFDGASLALDARGRLRARADQFVETILHVEVPLEGKRPPRISKGWKGATIRVPRLGSVQKSPRAEGYDGVATSAVPRNSIAPELSDLEQVYGALVLGLRDYVGKNGFGKVVLGLSGGVDSALVAAICVDALGADRVVGVTMPSSITASETLGDALRLAKNLGIEIHTVSIRRLHEAYLEELSPLWPGRPLDLTEENIQARIRANTLMALSNKFGWLVVTTGNKSEVATGYCTLYGDSAGGFSLIRDVPKTLVWTLSRWRNRSGEVIPETIIERAPSAELRPGQKDQDSLPPYDVLDEIIVRYLDRGMRMAAIVADGFDPEVVKRTIRLIDRSEFKRRQAAPGISLTPWVFRSGRRLPITNLYRV
ncbi:MAG: NAD+ synthase [Kiritimatiellae bacterium]|nr:NAD+ synthase [Kiritimatiellia bacterium]MCO5069271.1 NAD+ synthase [Kiritimatiellia bacterium]